MDGTQITREALDGLRRIGTATVCNALEILRPDYRDRGYTRWPLAATRPTLGPLVGVARVGRIRPEVPPQGRVPDRASWYECVATSNLPTMVVIEDGDLNPGTGAFWGQVNSLVHKTLGSVGCVTNGSFRYVAALAEGFQILGSHIGPSHAHVHIFEFGNPVEVCGMHVHHGDILHADYQGAVVVPVDCLNGLAYAVALITRREKVILDTCREPSFSTDKLKSAMARVKDIH